MFAIILLQAGIMFGMLLIAAIGAALLIGVPLLTYFISTYLSKQDKNKVLSVIENSQKTSKQKRHLFKSFVLSVVIIITIIIVGTFTLLLLMPDMG